MNTIREIQTLNKRELENAVYVVSLVNQIATLLTLIARRMHLGTPTIGTRHISTLEV